ncbi:recombinase family protein [Niallia taxi]|nr:recombinase family protein [Niallia taxi]MDE5053305.1 recombinase family protein [Niallia taxi]
MLIGYMRPSIEDKDCKEQLQILYKSKCNINYIEKHSSEKNRIELNKMLDNLNVEDKVIVSKLYAIADSTRHLVEILETIEARGAYFESLEEGIDTSGFLGYKFNYIVTRLVEFQSDVISQKTKKGLYEALQKGVSAGRPKKPDENVKKAIEMYQSKKYSLAEIKENTGISKSTLYRYLER